MLRLRQILAFIVLLLFSLESLANISLDAVAQSYTSDHRIGSANENIALFSFITEENENEERDDDKAHGPVLELCAVLQSQVLCPLASKISFTSPDISTSFGHQRVLTLTCRLLI